MKSTSIWISPSNFYAFRAFGKPSMEVIDWDTLEFCASAFYYHISFTAVCIWQILQEKCIRGANSATYGRKHFCLESHNSRPFWSAWATYLVSRCTKFHHYITTEDEGKSSSQAIKHLCCRAIFCIKPRTTLYQYLRVPHSVSKNNWFNFVI